MTWNPGDFGGLKLACFQTSSIWHPDIYLTNTWDFHLKFYFTMLSSEHFSVPRWVQPTLHVNTECEIHVWLCHYRNIETLRLLTFNNRQQRLLFFFQCNRLSLDVTSSFTFFYLFLILLAPHNCETLNSLISADVPGKCSLAHFPIKFITQNDLVLMCN